MPKKVQILSAEVIARKLKRMAYEIVEHNTPCDMLVIAGVEGRGEDIAQHLIKHIAAISKIKTQYVKVKMNKSQPNTAELSSAIELHHAHVIVVDDVVNSGKTLMFACKPLLDLSPLKLQVAVLVDRRHKSYPISADFVGTLVATTLQEHISVVIKDGEIQGAYLQ